jgi:nucleoside-diphosphate-sugar epimerase
VVVLARDPSKMLIPEGSGGVEGDKPLTDPRLKIVRGDVTDQVAVNAVFDAAESEIQGVIIALGGKTKDVGPTMLTDGTTRIINAMKLKGTKRVAVVTSIGTGDSENQAPLMFKALMYTVMRSIFADKNNQEQLFTSPSGPGHDLE